MSTNRGLVFLRRLYGSGFRAPSLVQLFTGSLTFSQGASGYTPFCCRRARRRTKAVRSRFCQVKSGSSMRKTRKISLLGLSSASPIVPGLFLSVDFFRVDVEHSISSLDPQFILDNEANFPGFVVRCTPPSARDMELGIPGQALLIDGSFQNLGFVKVQGIDIGAGDGPAHHQLEISRFDLKALISTALNNKAAKARRCSSWPAPLSIPIPAVEPWRAGVSVGFWTVFTFNYTDSYLDSPPDRTVDYDTTFDLFLQYRFGLGSGRTATAAGIAAQRDGKATIDGKRQERDIKCSRAVSFQANRWLDGLALRFGVRNIFDDAPPFANNTAGFPVALEDPRQRFRTFFDIEKKFW